jgi:proline dehydrogenase
VRSDKQYLSAIEKPESPIVACLLHCRIQELFMAVVPRSGDPLNMGDRGFDGGRAVGRARASSLSTRASSSVEASRPPDAPEVLEARSGGRPLGSTLLRRALLALGRQDAIRDLAMRLPAARAVAQRFVAGETRADALAAVGALRRRGLAATIDCLGENVVDVRQARALAAEYRALLDDLAGAGLQSHVSVKLTALGLDLDDALAIELVGSIAERAREHGSFVRVDMERSAYTARTLRIVRKLHEDHPNVGVVLQAYLYRTPADVEEAIRLGIRVRLCKGAYDEPPSVAHPLKRDVDTAFRHLSERLLADGDYPAIATHDPAMIDHARRFARARGIGPERYEFQMLYGIARDLQDGLVSAGHNVRIYVPYGTAWYGYFLRRLAERPANLLFFLRSVVRR